MDVVQTVVEADTGSLGLEPVVFLQPEGIVFPLPRC